SGITNSTSDESLKIHSTPALFLLIASLSTMSSAQQQPKIRYTLGMSRPSTHLFEVEVTIENLPPSLDSLDVMMPVCRPGRCVFLDLAGGVQDSSAAGARNKELEWSKVNKSTWRVRTERSEKLVARYKVYANEFSLRTRGLNDEHAFVDGSGVFMYVDQY